MKRQYTASAYVIDYENKKALLTYNPKLDMWLQPGGHIEENETPDEAVIREVKEETGIDIKITSVSDINHKVIPIVINHYQNKVGDMIDLGFKAIPLHFNIESETKAAFFCVDELDSLNIGKDIKETVTALLNEKR